MFLVVIESEGNAPSVNLFTDEKKALKAFHKEELNKWTQGVHLFEDEKVRKSRWYSDGEGYQLEYNDAGFPLS